MYSIALRNTICNSGTMAPSLSGKFHVTETGNSKNNWKFTLHAFINDTDTVVYTANINAGGAEKKLKVGDVIDFNDAGFFHGPDGKCSLTSFALTPVDPKGEYRRSPNDRISCAKFFPS